MNCTISCTYQHRQIEEEIERKKAELQVSDEDSEVIICPLLIKLVSSCIERLTGCPNFNYVSVIM